MKNSSIKKQTKEWAEKIGYHKAVGRLIARTVSARAAEKLCSGDYEYEPKALRNVLIEEMAKDGFSFGDEEAS